jgi:hypothetical protein
VTRFEPRLTREQRRGLSSGELRWQERKDGLGKLDALIDERSHIVGRPPLVEVLDEDSRDIVRNVAIAVAATATTYAVGRWQHRRQIRELSDQLRALSEEREALSAQLPTAGGDEERQLHERQAKVEADIIDLDMRRRELEARRPRLIRTG